MTTAAKVKVRVLVRQENVAVFGQELDTLEAGAVYSLEREVADWLLASGKAEKVASTKAADK